MTTTITPAIIDGLTRETGAINNGPNLPKPHPPRPHHTDHNGPIVVVQPAAEAWQCDDCYRRGYGGSALLHHAAVSNHFTYTAL